MTLAKISLNCIFKSYGTNADGMVYKIVDDIIFFGKWLFQGTVKLMFMLTPANFSAI